MVVFNWNEYFTIFVSYQKNLHPNIMKLYQPRNTYIINNDAEEIITAPLHVNLVNLYH